MIAPIAIWKRPLRLARRPATRRPPSISTYSTKADPTPYASATDRRAAVKVCDAETVMTPARIGPAHGAYTKPRPPPTIAPDQNPLPSRAPVTPETGPTRLNR